MSLEKILIVDDEDSIRNQLRWGLADEYEVHTAGTAAETRAVMKEQRPGIVTLDVTLGPAGGSPEGLELLDEIIEEYPATKVVMVTGNDSRENALAAIRRGAVDWYAKPIQLEELRVILRRAVHIRDIELAQSPDAPASRKRYHRLVGESEVMRRVFGLIQRVAPTDATVLIVGENGTGKELVAHAMHQASQRREEPFIPINCGAIPEALLESELFGHERGAFTDAYRTREGKFELADKGTLFLDEIGELPTHLQVKLLRFLQDHVVERVGGRDSMQVDARVVAATNRDLAQAVEAGSFRRDLHARLALWEIRVPALTERRADVLAWIERLRARWEAERGSVMGALEFEAEAVEALLLSPLAENLRTLDRLVHHLGLRREPVTVDELPSWLSAGVPMGSGGPAQPQRSEKPAQARRATPSKDEFQSTLQKLGSVRATAKHYDRDRRQIYRWIEAYGLEWKDADDDDAG